MAFHGIIINHNLSKLLIEKLLIDALKNSHLSCNYVLMYGSNVVLFDDFKDGTLEAEIDSKGEITVPVRALNIIWGNDSRFWRFKNLSHDESM